MAQSKTKSKAKKSNKKTNSKDKQPKPLSEIMDKIIKRGGNWDTILEKIDKVVKKRGMKTYTKGRVKAHIKRRLAKNPEYLGKRELTEEGIK